MSLLKDSRVMSESELKKLLEEKDGDVNSWSYVDNDALVRSMVAHIGSIDSELRDQLIYSSFYRFIIEENRLKHELLKELLDCCMNELLMKGIGENGTDTVFTRSFTTLLVALILYRDNQDSLLEAEKVKEVKEKLLHYMNHEVDLRGFVPNKGWAHSIAHVADTFDQLVKSTKLEKETYPEILNALWNKVLVSNSIYIHDEDERLLVPILNMLHNGLDEKGISTLLKELPLRLRMEKEQLREENYWFLVCNCKSFLKSFYVILGEKNQFLQLQESVRLCINKI
ncbi:DUF2785 domain-containing protein [Sutcliffiella rhizosphaerae]|uniref:DUF2785 domain-containing protein n=1 Tax=Sutcliffiella rhizosphaerae TaxID=2880967 RepID=A0ABN8A8V4_9BACI|nr:DUF2785 domain-containing protein [Sutcliffiella rhizosphaerae]CAG9621553.1 hypothetical protein BACCIP111883_02326 [Sutcliffiella rhizosphaerae]